jgi:anaerobic nitric oxide reductase flavorubredoxin
MKPVEIKPNIFWVGAIDWAIRDFHGYQTPRGTTYNNYLILDDEITLVDTVKYSFSEITIKNIMHLTDPANIKNIVINHIENDHVTSLDSIMALCPSAKIYITQKGKDGLARFFDISKWDVNVVKTGHKLKIGKKTLTFIETPMMHWPDSMMTYIEEDKLLISQDAFGQHIASTSRFDDEFVSCVSMYELEDAIWDYYANILMPFGFIIKPKIQEIVKMGLEIDMIAPDHGVIWRKNVGKIIQMYLDMADGKAEERVLIVYDTMWNSTEYMTYPIAQGIKSEGLDCRVLKLRATPLSVAITEFWKCRGTLIGAPTLNNLAFPPVMQLLDYLRGLRPKNRMMGAFGSYGWGGGAVKEMNDVIKKIGLELYEPGMEVKYRPSVDDETKCFEFGKSFAQKIKEYHKKF